MDECTDCSVNGTCNILCPAGVDPDCTCPAGQEYDDDNDGTQDACCADGLTPVDTDTDPEMDECTDCSANGTCNPLCPAGVDPDCTCPEGQEYDDDNDGTQDACCADGLTPVDTDTDPEMDECTDCSTNGTCNPLCPAGTDLVDCACVPGVDPGCTTGG